MSTPGGHDPYANPSNPYGGPTPYGAGQPGSAPPPPPGGPNPYGAPNPYGEPSGAAKQPMDGVSVAALVTAVLCCTGPIAVLLGIIGIVRTKNGRRRGRWMSVVGVVGGVLGTLTIAGVAVFGFWFSDQFGQFVTPGNAEKGDCVIVDSSGGEVSMVKWGCSVGASGQIIHVGTFDAATDAGFIEAGTLTTAICQARVDAADAETLAEAGFPASDWEMMADDPGDMSDGDPYVCFIDTGEPMDGPVLD